MFFRKKFLKNMSRKWFHYFFFWYFFPFFGFFSPCFCSNRNSVLMWSTITHKSCIRHLTFKRRKNEKETQQFTHFQPLKWYRCSDKKLQYSNDYLTFEFFEINYFRFSSCCGAFSSFYFDSGFLNKNSLCFAADIANEYWNFLYNVTKKVNEMKWNYDKIV